MDLEAFLTLLYVLVDDWYKGYVAGHKRHGAGAKPRMSDSEVLTVAIAGQWRAGVPWQSERGLVRYMQAHGKGMFPTMLQPSGFNQRVRYLWGAFILLQQAVADLLDEPTALYECVDSLPLPAFSPGQAQRDKGHWLWQSSLGHGAHGEWFWGDHLLACVSRSQTVTGWLLGTAAINDRWLLEAFLSARAGQPCLQAPGRRPKAAKADDRLPPVGFIGAFQAVGKSRTGLYLADKGFNGWRWANHWRTHYHAAVITVPPDNAKAEPPWSAAQKVSLASHRQIVETVFARLDQVFAIKRLQAHSRWGQYTRLAARMAAYNIGLFLNRLLGRPPGTLATLIC